MATIVKKDHALERECLKCKNKRNLGIVGVVVFFLTFAWAPWDWFDFLPVIGLAFVGCGALAGYYDNKARSYKSGVEGEHATAEIIASLPETYCGIQNLKITYEGKTSELDMVVIGPTGIFIIETKNLNGTIVGNYDNPQWTQKKIGQQGTPYSKNFYNPIKQVGTHVYRLANILKNNGFHVYVNDMVYFSNPDTVVQLIGNAPKTPVFTALGNSGKEICDFIMNSGQTIPQDVVWKIGMLLDEM